MMLSCYQAVLPCVVESNSLEAECGMINCLLKEIISLSLSSKLANKTTLKKQKPAILIFTLTNRNLQSG